MPATQKWKEENIDKMREYRRTWYKKNKKHAMSKIKERKSKLRLWIKEYKAILKCERCGQNHPATIQFHHLDPSKKDFNISVAVKNSFSIEKIQEEINKCIVLCANCHCIEHYQSQVTQF